MRKRKMIREVPQQHVANKVWMLTRLGKELACELTPHATEYNVDVSKVCHSRIRHTLACQDLVLANRQWLSGYVPETFIEIRGVQGEKHPDILLQHTSGCTTAVEAELRYKRHELVYRGYIAYLKMLEDQAISQVVYAFRSKSMRDKYLKLFDAETWPMFELNQKGRHVRQRDTKGREQRLQRQDVLSLIERFRFQLLDELVPAPRPNETQDLNLGLSPTRSRITISHEDWMAVDPEAEPDAIHYVTPEELFNPRPPMVKDWYRDAEGQYLGYVKSIGGRWHRLMVTNESGHCEKLTLKEFKEMDLERVDYVPPRLHSKAFKIDEWSV